jgi:type VI secretion system protein ImpM
VTTQCGFYGKVPSEGDFVSRRLPWEFTGPWDDWLQQGMQASRAALGERWLALYLSAPIWRFQMAPGVCGPQAWRGLFFASVDRVGRYFPLTVALADPSPAAFAPSLLTLTREDALWRAAEDAALAGLDPTLALDDFDRSIEALAIPAAAPAAPQSAAARVCLHAAGVQHVPVAGRVFDALPLPAVFVDLIASCPPAQSVTASTRAR